MLFSDIFKAKQYKADIENYLKEIERIKQKLEDYTKDIASLNVELDNIKSQNTQIIAENTATVENLSLRVERLRLINALLKAENQKYKLELNDYTTEIGKLTEKLNNLHLQNSKILTENETSKSELKNYTLEVAKLTESLIEKSEKLRLINALLKAENERYKSVHTDEHEKAINIKELLVTLQEREATFNKIIAQKEAEVKRLQNSVDERNKEIIILDDEILYQSFGLYTPLYDFATSEEYKEKLAEIRQKQKEMIKDKTAVVSYTSWTVNGSKQAGNKMTNDNIKQILRNFNAECENVIDRVKFNNFDSMYSRIEKSFEKLNSLNETNAISIQQSYLDLKFEELSLAYEYQLKKQEEKDEIRMLREQQREEAKLAKEIEEKRREIEKEQQHYENVLRRLDEQISVEKSEERLHLLINKRQEVEENLADLDLALKEVDYREANQKAGYVYIISNIGAFGENVYKIGMTRRLDPQERIDELGNASVPFRFDIHAMIFSDDAPRLENALHKAFENKKINVMNARKEFFNVTLEEIEEIVKRNHDKTVDFMKVPPAQQYRESLKTRQMALKRQ